MEWFVTFYLKYAIMHLAPVGMSVNSSEHWPREIMANESVIKLFLLYLTPHLPVISILDFIVISSIFGVKKIVSGWHRSSFALHCITIAQNLRQKISVGPSLRNCALA